MLTSLQTAEFTTHSTVTFQELLLYVCVYSRISSCFLSFRRGGLSAIQTTEYPTVRVLLPGKIRDGVNSPVGTKKVGIQVSSAAYKIQKGIF